MMLWVWISIGVLACAWMALYLLFQGVHADCQSLLHKAHREERNLVPMFWVVGCDHHWYALDGTRRFDVTKVHAGPFTTFEEADERRIEVIKELSRLKLLSTSSVPEVAQGTVSVTVVEKVRSEEQVLPKGMLH